jgi:2-polyprenyl-6-methoxyphenol hydroxylase-like FAD-dependent oxidoreductase/NAD(P)-dependent dehydrogenase (short-subunit alcohol dehydrogenase family)
MNNNAHAIIIGAGLGGLATAIGLSRAGFRVSLFEKAPELAPAGFGIGITTNGLQALQHLGAYDVVAREGCAVETSLIQTAHGELISRAPVKAIGERTGLPSRSFQRAALQRALLSLVPPDCVRLGVACSSVEQRGERVRVRFDDGTHSEGDFVIGADGVNSAVRRALHGEQPARHANYVVWLAVMQLEHPALKRGYNGHYWGVGSRFGMHDVGDGHWYWWATKNKARVPAELRELHYVRCAEHPAYRNELITTFAGFTDEVRHAIAVTPASRVFMLNTRDRDPLPHWGTGRVTLLGDAAHPMLTSLGQGASAAFEDAAVLTRCLSRDPDAPRALASYERLRIGPTTEIVNSTRRMSAIEQLDHPVAVRMRNEVFRRTPQALVDSQLEKLLTFSMPEPKNGHARSNGVTSPVNALPSRANGRSTAADGGAQIVIVTGASTGIGRAIAERLAVSGLTVLAGVRQPAAERELSGLGLSRLLPCMLDVTDHASIAAVVARAQELIARGGQLRAIVNNAALSKVSPLEAVSLVDLREHLEVNVIGAMAMTQAALPALLASRGHVLNIGSNIGRVAPPFLGPYAASKAALETLSDVLRRELAPFGVHVSLIVPGAVMTPVWSKMAESGARVLADSAPVIRSRYSAALQRFVALNQRSAERSRQTPEDVARAVERCVWAANPKPRYELGMEVAAGSIASRILPAAVLDLAYSRLLSTPAARSLS